jgi:hypothetical protein
LVKHYGAKFDAVHAAAAVAMLPKLYQPPAPGNHLNDKQLNERKQLAVKLLAQLQVCSATKQQQWVSCLVWSASLPTADSRASIASGSAVVLPVVSRHVFDTAIA